jgi:hypothetical protein
MKTIFDQTLRQQLLMRINNLEETATPGWGKMNIYQMLRHCTLVDEMYLGKRQYKRMFLGRILGPLILKKFVQDDTPMQQNARTSNDFIISEVTGNFTAERAKWIELIMQYETYSTNNFVHWFFGKMTREQVGILAYKHIDHHLRQFNS